MRNLYGGLKAISFDTRALFCHLQWRLSKGANREVKPPEYTANYMGRLLGNFEVATQEFKGKDGVKMLEIGSYEGMASLWLCNEILTGRNCSLTTVDKDPRPAFYTNTLPHRMSGKIKSIRGASLDVLMKLHSRREKFDFIYIDGSHFAINVLEDAVLAWRMLRKGGVLLFDDYLWEDKEFFKSLCGADYDDLNKEFDFDRGNPLTPKSAIDAFLRVYNLEYELIIFNYQVAIRKTCSFMEGKLGCDFTA